MNTQVYDMAATEGKILWWYNWGQEPSNIVTSSYQDYNYEFAPMVWNGNFDSTTLSNRITTDAKYLLGFNEPNFTDQANMTAQEAADLWPKLEGIASEHNLEIVSPAVNWCGGCTNGYGNDPIEWLDDFFSKCQGCKIDYVALHWYACSGDALENEIGRYKKYGKPIWITEFACWDTPQEDMTLDVQKNYLIQSVDLMENDPDVFRYSWFAPVDQSQFPYLALFTGNENSPLTELGEIYNKMPAHDTNYYYQAPLLLEAEEYASSDGIRLELCYDTMGMANVGWIDSGDWLEYKIDVTNTDDYSILFRVASATEGGTFDIEIDGILIGNVIVPNTGGWQNWKNEVISTSISAGKHTLKIKAVSAGFNINYMFINDGTLNLSIRDKHVYNKLKMYPNKISKVEKINIELPKEIDFDELTIKIYNSIGELVLSPAHSINTNLVSFNSSKNLKPDVYVVKIKSKNFIGFGKLTFF